MLKRLDLIPGFFFPMHGASLKNYAEETVAWSAFRSTPLRAKASAAA